MPALQVNALVAVAFATLVGACEPGWEIKNPATADQSVDLACVDAGVRAWSPQIVGSDVRGADALHISAVAQTTPRFNMHVQWEKKHPNRLEIFARAIGTEPPPGVLDAYRSTRDAVAASVGAACHATITLGAESCERCK